MYRDLVASGRKEESNVCVRVCVLVCSDSAAEEQLSQVIPSFRVGVAPLRGPGVTG